MICSEELATGGRLLRRAAIVACALVLMSAGSAGAQQLRGVALHPTASDDSASTIQREFGLLQSAGADTVRFDVFWTAVEWNGKGQYNGGALSWLDWVMSQAQSHGLKVILDVWSTPCWASSAPATITLGCTFGWWTRPVRYYPPKNPQDYADFAAFAAKRWQSSLAAIELWNEPNGRFLYSQDKAGDYAKLVRAAYPAVKAVAPTLPVLISMAGTDTSFLSALYADGVRGDYDGIAVHPYDQPTLDGLKALRAYEVGQGDTAPIWVTEVGWSSSAVGTNNQAADVTSMLQQLAALPYVSAAELYELRDEAFNPLDANMNFGLLYDNFYPKPAWYAFTTALSALHGT